VSNTDLVESSVRQSGGDTTYCSFHPLAHSERGTVLRLISRGGRVLLFDGSFEELFAELRHVRVTIFSAVPRVYNVIYSQYKEELDRELRRVQRSPSSMEDEPQTEPKLHTEPKPLTEPLEVTKARVRARFAHVFGDRISALVTGGAPTSPAVLQFLRDTYPCRVVEGYASTEAGAIAIDGQKSADAEVKLEDLPEMGKTLFP
jgi:long-subunit acyl-CoA synthetase (AMP-forming)